MNRLPSVVVLDYGSGNIRSAQRAVERAGAQVTVTADFQQALEADGLLVPGVGAYAACMEGLNAINATELVKSRIERNRPVLGICVGMQVLFGQGVEHGLVTPGMGLWPGSVDRLTAPVLPHMGWNLIDVPSGSRILDEVRQERFYFVHSYAATSWKTADASKDALVTTCEHGQKFIAAVEDGPLCATQFHPEKSGDAGAGLLSAWVKTLR